ncbi:hypothetical protein FOXB_04775 [Fusarium oxysporum f. sp. conglutinans Fo5176]|uniref:Uncharacterized protein n=1 Tax=Fusarium oxysporum (strain Fo5176) TaxID=660025 RepID=F9FEE7_FUSOF|nr:hypothetical protein FOXB_04775 [Fusarium oxysporum f. sp. conglutinans Fo5176]
MPQYALTVKNNIASTLQTGLRTSTTILKLREESASWAGRSMVGRSPSTLAPTDYNAGDWFEHEYWDILVQRRTWSEVDESLLLAST